MGKATTVSLTYRDATSHRFLSWAEKGLGAGARTGLRSPELPNLAGLARSGKHQCHKGRDRGLLAIFTHVHYLH